MIVYECSLNLYSSSYRRVCTLFYLYKLKNLLIYLKILHKNFSNRADIYNMNDNVVTDDKFWNRYNCIKFISTLCASVVNITIQERNALRKS